MATRDRFTITAAVLVCFLSSQSRTVLASDGGAPSDDAAPASTHHGETIDTSIEAPQLPADSSIPARPFAAFTSASRAAAVHFDAASDAFGGQVFRDRPIRVDNRDGSMAAMILGAAAAITGASLLFYANRPECDARPYAGGCGYGTKVIGGAVLTGGLVSVTIGALTW